MPEGEAGHDVRNPATDDLDAKRRDAIRTLIRQQATKDELPKLLRKFNTNPRVCEGLFDSEVMDVLRTELADADTTAYTRFVNLLKQAGITRPNKMVMERIQIDQPQAMLAAGTADVAHQLYERVQQYPNPSTVEALKVGTGVQLNGPYSAPNPISSGTLLVHAFHQGTIKLLKITEDASAEHEANLWREFGDEALACNLAGPLERVEIGGFTHSQRIGILMPLHPTTLAQAPMPLQEGDVLVIGQQVKAALVYLHGKGYGHNDVKPSNILLSTDGKALLCDFGSTKCLGQKIGTYTPYYLPKDVPLETSAQVDFTLLASTLLERVRGPLLRQHEEHLTMSILVGHAAELQREALKVFVLDLLHCNTHVG